MIAQVLRHTSIVSVTSLFSAISGFIFLAYAGRTLGPDYLGKLFLIWTIVGFFTRLINVSFSLFEIREIAAESGNKSAIVFFFITSRFLAGVAGYAILGIFLIFADYNHEIMVLTLLMGSTLLVEPVSAVGYSTLIATGRVGLASGIAFGFSVVGVFANIAVLMLGHGINGVVVTTITVTFLATIVWAIILWRALPRKIMKIRWFVAKTTLKKLRPTLPVMIFNASNHTVNTLMLSKILNPVEAGIAVGFFNSSLSIARAPFTFLGGFRQAIVAAVAGENSQGSQNRLTLAGTLRISSLTFALPMAVVFSFFSSDITLFVLGPDFDQAAYSLAILGCAMALGVVVMPMEAYLLSSGPIESLRLVPVTLVPLLINIILCLALIPIYGHIGASIALLGSRILYASLVARKFHQVLKHLVPSFIEQRNLMIIITSTLVGSTIINLWTDPLYQRLALTGLLLTGVASWPLINIYFNRATTRMH